MAASIARLKEGAPNVTNGIIWSIFFNTVFLATLRMSATTSRLTHYVHRFTWPLENCVSHVPGYSHAAGGFTTAYGQRTGRNREYAVG